MPGPATPTDRLIVVVSGHRSVGQACARALRDARPAGAPVVLIGPGAGEPGIEHRPVPPGSPDSAGEVLDELVAERGPASVLVEVSGLDVPGDRPVRRGQDAVVELGAVLARVHAVVPAMVAAGRGRIVLVAEASGVPGRSWDDGRSAAMWGLVGLARSLTREVAGAGVTVNVVRAGVVDTDDLQERRASDPEVAEAVAAAVAATPLRRMAVPDEVAAAVAYLASDEASFVTGVVVPVDGGLTMGLGS